MTHLSASTRRAPPGSERGLQVLEREQSAAGVEADPDRVEANLRRAWPLEHALSEPFTGDRAHLSLLRGPIEANGPSGFTRPGIPPDPAAPPGAGTPRAMRVFTSQKTRKRSSRATTSSSPKRVRKFRAITSNPRASRC